MSVTLVGSGPAVEAIEAAFSDTEHELSRSTSAELSGALSVVVGRAGAEVFTTANASAKEQGTPWIAVELGGVGGVAIPSVQGAVSGYDPTTTACFDCLRTRVRSCLEQQPADHSPDTAPETARFVGALAGREGVGVLSGSSSVLGSVIEVPHAVRSLHPVAGCGCTGDREWTLSREFEDRPLEQALERAERAVDDRIGVVREVGEVESFPVPYYLAKLADTSPFSAVRASQQAAGVAAGWDRAFMKALGEALERYCAGVYDNDSLHTASPGGLSNPVDPSEFVRPDDPGDEPIEWVLGENLATEETVALPAARVLFPYEGPGPAITTGLSLGNSGASALLGGLTEIIERDAALLAWYSTYEPLGLAIDDEEYETLTKRAHSERLSVTATLLTQDIDVPVVGVAVHRDADDWPAFALGLACDLDPTVAARSACSEALQNWTELRQMGRSTAQTAGGRIGHFASRPRSIEDFVAPTQTIPASTVTTDVPTGADALDALVDRLTDAGLSAYAARLTTPDIEALGFEAVRALVPRAQPLFIDEPYFGDRANTVPTELGFEPRLQREHHPYP